MGGPWFNYIEQYSQEWDEPPDVFLANPYHGFASYAAEVHRYVALMENQMINEDERLLEDNGTEEHDYIHD